MIFKIFILLLSLTFSTLAFPLDESCTEKTGCELKKCELGIKIIYAEKMKDKREVAGLNKALDSLNKECSDDTLNKDHATKMHKKEKEVAMRTRELRQARKSGKKDKIAKKTARLNEAKAELEEIKTETK